MTLQDLANLAGVSVSTVSKAFSNSKEISEKTRSRILQIAREKNCYEQFYKGIYLKKVIAVICPEIQSEWYHHIVTCLDMLTASAGITMVLSISHFDAATEEALFSYHTYYQKADGVIIIDNRVKLVNPSRIPVVLIDSKHQGNFDSINTDLQAGINEVVLYLKEMGHRKIGFIGERLTTEKQDYFLHAMRKYALPVVDDFIATSNERFQDGGYLCMEQLLAKSQHPTAILAAYDYMAVGAIKCAKNHGLSVPEDISFIGMDNIRMASYTSTPLTSLQTHTELKCETAMNLLLKKMENKYFTERQKITLDCTLIKRESVRRLS